MLDYCFGFVFGMIAMFFIGLTSDNEPSRLMENCAKEHNVYECKLIAVPKDQN